jgi:hypothetical protein
VRSEYHGMEEGCNKIFLNLICEVAAFPHKFNEVSSCKGYIFSKKTVGKFGTH